MLLLMRTLGLFDALFIRPTGATYSTLDGLTEASLEFRSVSFAATAAKLATSENRLAMLSLGGASMQLSSANSYTSFCLGVRQVSFGWMPLHSVKML